MATKTKKQTTIKLTPTIRRKLLAVSILCAAKIYEKSPFEMLRIYDPDPDGLLLKEVFKLAVEHKMLGSEF